MEKQFLQNSSDPVISNLSNKLQYFEGLPPEVSNFRIDSYQICKNWFKARNGRPLGNEDLEHYQRIVTVLKEMIKLIEEIKTTFQDEQLKKLKIFERLRFVVADKLGIEANKVTPIANFAKDLGADSLDTVELVMALEEAFNIEIPDQTAEKLLTVQQAIGYISHKVEIVI